MDKSVIRWGILALGLMVVWAVAMTLFSTPGQAGIPPALEGTGMQQPADFGWKLTDLDGKPVEFSQFRGRPILLNLWATWCGPCRAEMPSLAKLAANIQIQAKNVAIVCVSLDNSVTAPRGYVEGKNWTMTMLHADGVPPVFETDGIPATFLIAPDGRIVAHDVGQADWDGPEVVAFLSKLASASK